MLIHLPEFFLIRKYERFHDSKKSLLVQIINIRMFGNIRFQHAQQTIFLQEPHYLPHDLRFFCALNGFVPLHVFGEHLIYGLKITLLEAGCPVFLSIQCNHCPLYPPSSSIACCRSSFCILPSFFIFSRIWSTCFSFSLCPLVFRLYSSNIPSSCRR